LGKDTLETPDTELLELTVPVFSWPDFGSDEEIAVLAIVEQENSTNWILPGWRGRVDHVGKLLIGPE
jgi:N-methylhydantoinase A/oxoprolinase/acetone carboxylase beta subunit